MRNVHKMKLEFMLSSDNVKSLTILSIPRGPRLVRIASATAVTNTVGNICQLYDLGNSTG